MPRGVTAPVSVGISGTLLLLSLIAAAPKAHAADAQPFDFVTAPAGTNLALLYYAYGNSTEYKDSQGDKVPGSSLESNIIIARYVRYFELGGMTADVNVIQPFGGFNDVKIGGNDLSHEDFNIGNTTLVFTIWPVNNTEKQIYFGIANYLNMPTGSYDSDQSVNLGDNRWSFTVQPALHAKVYDKISVDLVGDITVYADNNDAAPNSGRLSQDPSFTRIGWLNYSFTPATAASIGVSYTYNGEEELDGVNLGDSYVTKIRAAVSTFVTPTIQVLLQVDHDVDVKNSFSQDFGGMIRLLKVF
jgi:hypothetical protein